MRVRIVLLVWLVIGGCAYGARACTCGMPASPCAAFKKHDNMFLGTVLRMRDVSDGTKVPKGEIYLGGRWIVTIGVSEDFSGQHRPGDQVEVETNKLGSACGYEFRLGQRYLVDAGMLNGKMTTSHCSETSTEADAAIMLRALRAGNGQRIPDLTGMLIRRVPHGPSGISDADPPPAPVPNIAVTVTGKDGQQFHTSTQVDGVYEIPALLPGSYEVAFILPDTLALLSGPNEALKIAIPEAGGTGAGCKVSQDVYPAGTISGRITGADGRGVAGYVYAYSTKQFEDGYYSWSQATTSKDDGNFTLRPLSAGAYRIRFEPTTDRNVRTYYPGTLDKAQAKLVTVEEGKPAPPISFAMPR